jgi:hypothetical protein
LVFCLVDMGARLRKKPEKEEKMVSLTFEVSEGSLILHGETGPFVKELTLSFQKKGLLVPHTISVPVKDGRFSAVSSECLPEGEYDVSVIDGEGNVYKSRNEVRIPPKTKGA